MRRTLPPAARRRPHRPHRQPRRAHHRYLLRSGAAAGRRPYRGRWTVAGRRWTVSGGTRPHAGTGIAGRKRNVMNAARVSVIVPCYNLGPYLDEAIDSVFAQTFQDFEIVVVDDGSTDPDTRRLLASYERPRTRLVRSDNRGLPATKNLGLAHTTGPYV